MWFIRDISYSVVLTAIVLVVLMSQSIVIAQVRSSSNYQLQSDSINVGGGLSTSTSFRQESTIGEIATGRSTSSNFSLQAGYQQMQEVFLSLSAIADIVMTPDLPGITGGISTGSTTFTVVTDSPSGYQVTLQAANDPAMQRGDGAAITNYNDGNSADFTFSIPATSAVFGFTPEGIDVADAFLDNGGTCGIGSSESTDSCWAGVSTTPVTIVESTDSNHPDGATSTLKFQVGIASGANIETGVYTATTTITALPL